MDTTFQTQTQDTMQKHDEGFLKGLRVIPLSAVIGTLFFMGYLENFLSHISGSAVFFVTDTLYCIVFALTTVVLAAHTLCGEKAKTLGLVAVITAALRLIVSLIHDILLYIANSNYTPMDDTVQTILQIVLALLSIATFAVLTIGSEKKYRLGFILLTINFLLIGIKCAIPHEVLISHLLLHIPLSIINTALFTTGFAYLFYQGIVSHSKKEPRKLALEAEYFCDNILYKVLNCCAAGFILVFIIFASFYRPSGYEQFMPAGGYLFEVVLLLLITNLVALGIKFKTLATKIMSFSFAGLMLTINLILLVVIAIEEHNHFNQAFHAVNIVMLYSYGFLAAILFWIAKTQATGTTRKVFALSTTSLVSALYITCQTSYLFTINFSARWGEVENYNEYAITVIAIFMVLPWLIFQLLTSAWPKVRPLFFALPIIILMLVFTGLRMCMNGSWEAPVPSYSDYNYESSTQPYGEESTTEDSYDYDSSEESYTSDDEVTVDSMPVYDEMY